MNFSDSLLFWHLVIHKLCTDCILPVWLSINFSLPSVGSAGEILASQDPYLERKFSLQEASWE